MNGDLVQIVDLIDTLGTFGVLIFVVVAFFRGSLISRKVHDDIVGVYQEEAEKLTNSINGSLKKLAETQQQSIESSDKRHASFIEEAELSRERVRESADQMIKIMHETLVQIKEHDKKSAKLASDAIKALRA